MNKLEKLLFYLFVFALPFQTRIILKVWTANPAVNFNEWTSAFLYGTDILILLLFILGAKRIFNRIRKTSLADFFLLAFFLVSASSVLGAENKTLGLYRLVKILEFIALYYYTNASLNVIFNFPEAVKAILISGTFQSVIAVLQSLFQKSLGLKLLGESFLRTNLNAVAVVPAVGTKFLRAYGTLPHPNLLAAWLFLAIFAFYFWYLSSPSRDCRFVETSRARYCQRSLLGLVPNIFSDLQSKTSAISAPGRWLVLSVYPLILTAFLFTFSRTIVGLWILGLILRLIFVAAKRKSYQLSLIFKKRLYFLVTISVVTVLVFSFFYWPQVKSRISLSTDDLAVSERIFYNKMASQTALSNPFLGVGLGNFVWHTLKTFHLDKPYLYQPAHNIYILIASESGFVGLGLFLLFVFYLTYSFVAKTGLRALHHLSLFIVFISVLSIGLFDHFFWTLQQGQIIFWMFLGLVSSLS